MCYLRQKAPLEQQQPRKQEGSRQQQQEEEGGRRKSSTTVAAGAAEGGQAAAAGGPAQSDGQLSATGGADADAAVGGDAAASRRPGERAPRGSVNARRGGPSVEDQAARDRNNAIRQRMLNDQREREHRKQRQLEVRACAADSFFIVAAFTGRVCAVIGSGEAQAADEDDASRSAVVAELCVREAEPHTECAVRERPASCITEAVARLGRGQGRAIRSARPDRHRHEGRQ